jgi:hypothetical protein
MQERRHTILAKLRPLFGALLVLSGWFAAPIALSARPADACEMACCVRQKSCCCRIRHARVKGQPSEKGPQVESRASVNGCPNSCANTQISLKQSYAEANKTSSLNPFLTAQSRFVSPRPVIAIDGPQSGSSTPRAPPVLA